MDHDDDDERHWYDDERHYSSSRDSDDSPLLSQRVYEKRRYAPYPIAKADERERRSTISLLMKFFLFCTAMIMFCVLLYIPVYNKASYQMSKALVAGWSQHTNRDTKLYVLPNNVTLIHEPTNICKKPDTNTKNKLLLLVIVCSSTENFERRVAIRNTWGNHKKYKELNKVFHLVRERYKDYNFTYDLYDSNSTRDKREASGISRLLPEIAKALQSNLVNTKTDSVPEEKRFDEDVNNDDVKDGDVKTDDDDIKTDETKSDDDILQEFGMNKEFGERTGDYDYDYESNIMKIPPKGYEDNPDLEKVLNLLKNDKNFPKIRDDLDDGNNGNDDAVEFKLVFLLGLPVQKNDSTVQDKIEEEVEKYGDVIQEGFIDSYNNLTLKSIMMLKWINNKCNDSVRYVLKTDDDMYVNVPNLVANLQNRSREHDAKRAADKEYLLIGDLICGARPVLDSTNKWYSPRYMYGGRVYPKYLSGTGYLFSAPAARALYDAALKTPYFHLEDIYITGICALRASPRLSPRDDPSFTYSGGAGDARGSPCVAHAHATLHRVPPRDMALIRRALAIPHVVDTCERKRLTQVRRDRLRPKTQPKRLTKHLHIH